MSIKLPLSDLDFYCIANMSNSKFVHRANAPFTLEQYKFIIKKGLELDGPESVRRAFRLEFYPRNPGKVPHRKQFARVINQFETYGTVHSRVRVKPSGMCDPNNIETVKTYLREHPKATLRKCSGDTGLNIGTIWRICRKVLKFKFYRPNVVQVLSGENMEARVRASNFFETFDDSEMDDILWSDEKWFVLNQSPNRKNDGIWGPMGTENVWATKKAHGQKIMAWCGMIRGRVILHWFEGGVDGDTYLQMLQDVVWPVVKDMKNIWFMQDGAPAHVMPAVLEFLHQKFGNNIISRKTAYPWPAYSPDLNPLDYSFWSQAMAHVIRCQPKTIPELMEVVEDFVVNFDPEIASRVVRQVKYRAALCKSVGGGHFQHLLKKKGSREE